MNLSPNHILRGIFLAGAIAGLSAFHPAFDTESTQPLISQSSTRAIVGTIVGFGEADENEWLVQTENGTVRVDAGPRWYQTIPLSMGETVTITGEFDQGEFDAFTISRADGSVIEVRQPQGPPPWAGGPNQQPPEREAITETPEREAITETIIVGTVIDFGEADENEWLVQTENGTVRVDAGPRWDQTIPLSMGETVTITGEFDQGEFDAFTISRADGSVIEVRQPQGPPPWAGGPNQE